MCASLQPVQRRRIRQMLEAEFYSMLRVSNSSSNLWYERRGHRRLDSVLSLCPATRVGLKTASGRCVQKSPPRETKMS